MKCGARVAIGVAGGYFLGRTKKMKLALMLGGLAAGRRTGGPGGLLGQGAKLVGSSPELAALRDQLTGRLVEAGKGAVMSVAARQIESLTDRVSDRVESLADPERLSAVRPRRKGRAAADEEDNGATADRATDEDDAERLDDDPDEGADPGDEDAEPAPAKSTTRSRSSSRSTGTSATSARNRTSTRGASSGRSSDSGKASSSDNATPKRRTAGAAATRSAGAARSGAKSATTRAARGSRSSR